MSSCTRRNRRYDTDEIEFALSRILARWDFLTIIEAFIQQFGEDSENPFDKKQLGYIRSRFGKDPHYAYIKPYRGAIQPPTEFASNLSAPQDASSDGLIAQSIEEDAPCEDAFDLLQYLQPAQPSELPQQPASTQRPIPTLFGFTDPVLCPDMATMTGSTLAISPAATHFGTMMNSTALSPQSQPITSTEEIPRTTAEAIFNNWPCSQPLILPNQQLNTAGEIRNWNEHLAIVIENHDKRKIENFRDDVDFGACPSINDPPPTKRHKAHDEYAEMRAEALRKRTTGPQHAVPYSFIKPSNAMGCKFGNGLVTGPRAGVHDGLPGHLSKHAANVRKTNLAARPPPNGGIPLMTASEVSKRLIDGIPLTCDSTRRPNLLSEERVKVSEEAKYWPATSKQALMDFMPNNGGDMWVAEANRYAKHVKNTIKHHMRPQSLVPPSFAFGVDSQTLWGNAREMVPLATSWWDSMNYRNRLVDFAKLEDDEPMPAYEAIIDARVAAYHVQQNGGIVQAVETRAVDEQPVVAQSVETQLSARESMVPDLSQDPTTSDPVLEPVTPAQSFTDRGPPHRDSSASLAGSDTEQIPQSSPPKPQMIPDAADKRFYFTNRLPSTGGKGPQEKLKYSLDVMSGARAIEAESASVEATSPNSCRRGE